MWVLNGIESVVEVFLLLLFSFCWSSNDLSGWFNFSVSIDDDCSYLWCSSLKFSITCCGNYSFSVVGSGEVNRLFVLDVIVWLIFFDVFFFCKKLPMTVVSFDNWLYVNKNIALSSSNFIFAMKFSWHSFIHFSSWILASSIRHFFLFEFSQLLYY